MSTIVRLWLMELLLMNCFSLPGLTIRWWKKEVREEGGTKERREKKRWEQMSKVRCNENTYNSMRHLRVKLLMIWICVLVHNPSVLAHLNQKMPWNFAFFRFLVDSGNWDHEAFAGMFEDRPPPPTSKYHLIWWPARSSIKNLMPFWIKGLCCILAPWEGVLCSRWRAAVSHLLEISGRGRQVLKVLVSIQLTAPINSV